MNNWSITGNVGKDAETRQARDTSVTSWSVAVKSGYGDREQTIWVRCSMWGARGERIADYIRKGDQIGVTGEMGTQEHDGKTYITLKVTDVTLISGKKRDGEKRGSDQRQARSDGAHEYRQRSEGVGQSSAPTDDFTDDDIPF